MATRSVVGFVENDETFGTYVHYDGYPENMIPALEKKLEEEGFDSVKTWVLNGIAGGGYSSVDETEPYNDNLTEWNMSLDDEEYGYLVSEDGVEMVHEEVF